MSKRLHNQVLEKIVGNERYRFDIGWTKFDGQDPYFSITGSCDENVNGKWKESSGGCLHDDFIRLFPELKELVKYHLISTKEPMHYVANTLYHAQDKDCHGLKKGEKRQIKNGKTGMPCWTMMAVDKETGEEIELYKIDKSIDSTEKPDCKYSIEYRPWCRVGEGKEPDLKAARSCAVWPDAKLSDFTKEKLEARLPILMKQMKKDLKSAGIKWPVEE